MWWPTGRDNRFYVWNPSRPRCTSRPRTGSASTSWRPCADDSQSSSPTGSRSRWRPPTSFSSNASTSSPRRPPLRECGVHPDTIRSLARKAATRRTKIWEGFDTAKHYHGDLMERAMDLLLALTGNWGRPGRGLDTLVGWPFEGAYLIEMKDRAGIEAADQLHGRVKGVTDMLATERRRRRLQALPGDGLPAVHAPGGHPGLHDAPVLLLVEPLRIPADLRAGRVGSQPAAVPGVRGGGRCPTGDRSSDRDPIRHRGC